MVNYSSPILIILTVLLTSSCANKKTELAWEQNFPLIGTQSSPRATDLNNDGIKDIVIGAGRAELDSTPHGVIALDGDTGEALWIKSTQAQIVGSASFIDITNDGIQDVFIGGRNHILKAIDGSSGDLIWEYQNESLDDPNLLYARYNFYSSCVIPDKNNNGYPELLTINGGNWEAKPNDNGERFPGVLMLIDSKDGNVIAADTMPDGKESYMSPISFKQVGSNQLNILIGTGGETIGGNLYLTSLDDLINDNLESAQLLLSEPEHGFIAPPSLADINNDKVLDFLIATHSANLIAVDGSNFETLWQHSFKGYECSSSFTVGQFTDDEVPDAFTIISNGVWPDYSHGLHLMINGSTGEVEYKKSLG